MGRPEPVTVQPRFRLYQFDTVESTQVELKSGYESGRYKPGDIIIADTQTGGYGRRGRVWQSPPGNMYASFIDRINNIGDISWLGYAVGLGLYEAIKPLLPAETKLELKWPNDVLLEGHKLAGILLEVLDDNIVAIGMGMNIAVSPQTDQKITILNNYTHSLYQPHEIIHRFISRYAYWYDLGIANGFNSLRKIWLERAAYKGAPIKARLADGNVIEGIFMDINQHGALVLSTESGHHTVTTADIFIKQNDDDKKNTTR